MSDILQEVDDALKQDRMLKIWHRYGRFIIAFLILIIAMTAAKSAADHYHRTTSERATTALLTILNSADDNKSTALAAFIETQKSGSTVIASLQLAGQYLSNGDKDAALATFDALSTNSKATNYFQDFSKLMAIQIKMDALTEETRPQIKADLDELINDDGSVWRYHAMLNRAALLASVQDYAGALLDAAAVKSAPNMPETLIKRAIALEQLYTIRLGQSDSL
tara:strand:+ start:245688 stop:246356 length:669 start_codon:yes stop_codon:yes gene_type:complete